MSDPTLSSKMHTDRRINLELAVRFTIALIQASFAHLQFQDAILCQHPTYRGGTSITERMAAKCPAKANAVWSERTVKRELIPVAKELGLTVISSTRGTWLAW
jgi:hypothetical protein